MFSKNILINESVLYIFVKEYAMKAIGKGVLWIGFILVLFAFSMKVKAQVQEGQIFLNASVNACATQEDAEEVAKLPFPETLELLEKKTEEGKCGIYIGVFMVMEKVAQYEERMVFKLSIPSGYLYGLYADRPKPKEGLEV